MSDWQYIFIPVPMKCFRNYLFAMNKQKKFFDLFIYSWQPTFASKWTGYLTTF